MDAIEIFMFRVGGDSRQVGNAIRNTKYYALEKRLSEEYESKNKTLFGFQFSEDEIDRVDKILYYAPTLFEVYSKGELVERVSSNEYWIRYKA